ncbi:hypothetical protein ENSA7_33050 [Enhygromyxa salina]|uniref:SpoIIAA-like protein n=1 Tax=Enhygromyxa salina TaxID=215803 RepID=A0A2S9YPF2_9BACT|nr:hypothetical protein ENSA7_33050 [Enhygromyxa salina]
MFILYHPVTPSLDVALREAKAYLEMRRHFESMVVLIWLGKMFPPPSAEVRAGFAAAFAAGPTVTAVAWIVDTEHSLGASIVHSVSMQMFSSTAQVRLFRDPFDAASWLSSIEGTDAELILDGLEALDRAQPA